VAAPVSALLLADPLARRSVEVLKRGQASSGAFVASPSFPVYRYAWLRDGSFCAQALDAVGEREAAGGFHRWVARSVEAHRALVEAAIARTAAGEPPPPEAMPPARYTLDGDLEQPSDEAWPNFQIDGYGIWLWALGEHVADGVKPTELAATVDLVARYLRATWRLKCFNCWEELEGGEHASTIGAVIAGLDAAARLLDHDGYAAEAVRVRHHLVDRFVIDGRFRRAPTDDRLDGSLLWLGIPFGVLPPEDARVSATVDAVRRDLAGPAGGIYRYRGDTYYGGGEWLLLTSSLAWHDAVTGTHDSWERAQSWVRQQALTNGDLPEQVSTNAQDPSMVAPWVRRWGPIATPLLWSHAMYVIAQAAVG
jgi:GH15 family glucan-1,4-alpha-glucosidase